MNDEVIYPILH